MPEIVTKYKIFIASPSDLAEDRLAIDEIIQELNLTFGNQNNLVIEQVKWETHSAPGISEKDVQNVIKNDIGNQYDLFIGLMWMKFGTPTKEFGSGTEEEFNIALEHFQDNPNSIQILFYFKESLPQSLQDIIPEELEKVNRFRDSLGGENTLYWKYNSIENLQRFLRIHIPKRINTLISYNSTLAQTATEKDSKKKLIVDESDLGLLDYIDIFEDKIEIAKQAVNNIATATEWIGEKITEKADEITRINSNRFNPNKALLRRALKQSAQFMNEYASRINVEIPIYYDNYEDCIKAFSSIINISDDFFDNENIDELAESKEMAIGLHSGIDLALVGMESFYQSVINLPRIDKEINKAKRNVAEKLQSLIKDLNTSQSMTLELIKEISEKIDRIEITFANKRS